MQRVRDRPTPAHARPAGLLRLWRETRPLFAPKPRTRPTARVNPLAFLSGTALLFVTLAVVALTTTWDCWQVIAGTLLGSPYRTAVDRCLEGIATAIQVNDGAAATPAAEQSSLVGYAARACANPYASASTAIASAAVAALVAGTITLIWCWPAWSIHHRRLIPFPHQELGALGAGITALVTASGVRRVEFLLDAADRRVAGRAFGRPGRRYVVLSRGLTTLYRTEPGMVRAVIAHELAHLRNRDVDASYAAVWAWRVFTIVTIVPMAAWALWSVAEGQGGTAWTYGWRTIAATILGLLVRGWLLRFRECLADARAHADGADEITDLLSRLQPAAHRRRLGEWLSLHPTPGQRAKLLEDPRRLMKTGFWESIAIGAIAMLANDIADMTAAVSGIHSTATVYFGAAATVMIITWSVSQGALRSALVQRFEEKKSFYRPWTKMDFLGNAGAGAVLAVVVAELILGAFGVDYTPVLGSFLLLWVCVVFGWSTHKMVRLFYPAMIRIYKDTTPTWVVLLPGIRVGLGMSLGLLAGRFIALSPVANTDVGHTAPGVFALFMRWGLWIFVGSFFVVTWCYLAARIWIPVIARAARPRIAALAALAVCSLTMLTWLPRFMTIYYFYENLPWERAGIPGSVAASFAFSKPEVPSSYGLWVAQVSAAILGLLILLPLTRRSAAPPREWVTLDQPIRVPWYNPASVRFTALALSFIVTFVGAVGSDFSPGTWLGLNISAMALNPASPSSREVVPADALSDGTGIKDPAYQMLNMPSFGAPISREDLVIYRPGGIAWWRGYVLALPGDQVASAGGGAPILIDGHRIDGPIPGNEETTSQQPLRLQVPPGKLWVTGVHWNLAAPDAYYIGEPGGGLIDQAWVVAFEPRANIGHMCPEFPPDPPSNGTPITTCPPL
jgi:Zn-dependent protease with chaperone function